MKCLTINPEAIDIDALVERGTSLHGHCGPFRVLGIRMGLQALPLLHHPGYFGLRAESEAGSTPPLSCLNDGIQVGSGCTMGKGNLSIVGNSRPRVRFVADDGASISIEIRADVLRAVQRGEIDARGTRLRRRPSDELFAWTSPTSPSTASSS